MTQPQHVRGDSPPPQNIIPRLKLHQQPRLHMPNNMAMQRPQPRIIRHEPYQTPPIRIHSHRIPPDRILDMQPGIIRLPIKRPAPRLHDPELVPVQMEGVRALVQAVDQEIDDRVVRDRQHELARAEGGAEARRAERRVGGVQARDGLVQRGVLGHRRPGGGVDVGAVEGVGADLEGHGHDVHGRRGRGGRGDGGDQGGGVEVFAGEVERAGPVYGGRGGCGGRVGVAEDGAHVGVEDGVGAAEAVGVHLGADPVVCGCLVRGEDHGVALGDVDGEAVDGCGLYLGGVYFYY